MITENKNYFVDVLNSSKANKFTARFHYSGVGFKKAQLNLGVFRKEDSRLVGVLQWGCNFQEGIRLDRYVKEPITKESYLELNRFCMDDSEGANSESQAISLGMKWIKQNRPDIRLLVSYAGRKEGNYGYIYQATNWEYLGYFVSDGFWIVDGEERHKITLWYRTRNSEKSFLDALKDMYSDIRETHSKQFIYIQRLDKHLTPASPILPYPKPTNEFPIVVEEIVHKRDDSILKKIPPSKLTTVEYYYSKDDLLFTRRTLIRRGELQKRDTQYYNKVKIAVFSESGFYEKTYNGIQELLPLGFKSEGIKKAIKTNCKYLKKYFKIVEPDEEIPEQIEVPLIGVIDEIPFGSYTEAAKYLNISRQAVHAAHKNNTSTVGGKKVIWY